MAINYKTNYYKHYGLAQCDTLFCIICGRPAVNLHHVIHRSHGGTDDPSNLVPMCFNCHSGHHDRNDPTTEEILMKLDND